jgi:hypothetical protein
MSQRYEPTAGRTAQGRTTADEAAMVKESKAYILKVLDALKVVVDESGLYTAPGSRKGRRDFREERQIWPGAPRSIVGRRVPDGKLSIPTVRNDLFPMKTEEPHGVRRTI